MLNKVFISLCLFFAINNISFSLEKVDFIGITKKIPIFIEVSDSPCGSVKTFNNILEDILFKTIGNSSIFEVVRANDLEIYGSNYNINLSQFSSFDTQEKGLALQAVKVRYGIFFAAKHINADEVKIEYMLFDFSNLNFIPILQESLIVSYTKLYSTIYDIGDKIISTIGYYRPYFNSKILYVAESSDSTESRTLHVIDRNGYGDSQVPVLSNAFNPFVIGSKLFFFNYSNLSLSLEYSNIGHWDRKSVISSDYNAVLMSPRLLKNDQKNILLIEMINDTSYISKFNLDKKIFTRLFESKNIILYPNLLNNGDIIYNDITNHKRTINRITTNSGFFNIFKETVNAPITTSNDSYFEPTVSPDERYIVFTKVRNGQYHLGIMNIDGSNERIIFSAYKIEKPSWNKNSFEFLCSMQDTKKGMKYIGIFDINGNMVTAIKAKNNMLEPHWFNFVINK